MRVLSAATLTTKPIHTFKVVKELKDSYIIYYYRTYDATEVDEIYMSFVVKVSVDELYYLNSDKKVNINKFKDGFTIALDSFIRRKLFL